jgi:hypothetical protein
MTCESYGAPIQRGFVWRQGVVADGAPDYVPFPTGATYRGEVRAKLTDQAAIAQFNTAGGGITRLSDTELRLQLTPAQTAAIPAGVAFVWLGLVRTDVSPEEPLDFMLQVDVWTPPTRPTP